MAAFGTAFGAAAAPNSNPNKDVEVPSPPSDGISSLKFSPANNLLVATSWSGQVLCWEVQANGQAIPKAAITSDKPVLCSAWSSDGTTVFAGARGRRGNCLPVISASCGSKVSQD
jgi:mRNA export factor